MDFKERFNEAANQLENELERDLSDSELSLLHEKVREDILGMADYYKDAAKYGDL